MVTTRWCVQVHALLHQSVLHGWVHQPHHLLGQHVALSDEGCAALGRLLLFELGQHVFDDGAGSFAQDAAHLGDDLSGILAVDVVEVCGQPVELYRLGLDPALAQVSVDHVRNAERHVLGEHASVLVLQRPALGHVFGVAACQLGTLVEVHSLLV